MEEPVRRSCWPRAVAGRRARVITAVGLYFFFAPIGLTGSYLGLILAHTALATPFVVITVGATLQSFDTNLARAAASLGASPLDAFRRVILPLILPGVASGPCSPSRPASMRW